MDGEGLSRDIMGVSRTAVVVVVVVQTVVEAEPE